MPTFLSNLLPGLTFGSPLILAALVLLPAIWWLLRVTPPMARRQRWGYLAHRTDRSAQAALIAMYAEMSGD